MNTRIVAIVVPADMSFDEFNQLANAAKRTDAEQIIIASVWPRDVSKENTFARESADSLPVAGTGTRKK